MALAESLQEVVGKAASVADLASAAFSETLGDYPNMELQWLRLLHQSKTSQVSMYAPSRHHHSFLTVHAPQRCLHMTYGASRTHQQHMLPP